MVDQRLETELVDFHAAIARHHDPDVVAKTSDRLRQCTGNVCQPAGLGKRHTLGGQVEDLQLLGVVHDGRCHLRA